MKRGFPMWEAARCLWLIQILPLHIPIQIPILAHGDFLHAQAFHAGQKDADAVDDDVCAVGLGPGSSRRAVMGISARSRAMRWMKSFVSAVPCM